MRRRRFVTCLAGSILAAPLCGWAQASAKMHHIGFLVLANTEPAYSQFVAGMQKLGYVEGRNLRITLRSAQGNTDQLPEFAAELVRLKVDVIVSVLTPAIIAATKATQEIPIVMAGAGDPVGTGIIASLARPGGNVTGTAGATTEIIGKSLEFMRAIKPTAKRGAVLANATDPITGLLVGQLERTGKGMSIDISPVMVKDEAEYAGAFRRMAKEKADFVVIQPSLRRKIAAELALKHRIPAIASNGAFPDEGGLLSYAADIEQIYGGAATYVDKILKGAKPADLPVAQPTRFDLAVNLKTAKALRLTIPQSVRARADRIVE